MIKLLWVIFSVVVRYWIRQVVSTVKFVCSTPAIILNIYFITLEDKQCQTELKTVEDMNNQLFRDPNRLREPLTNAENAAVFPSNDRGMTERFNYPKQFEDDRRFSVQPGFSSADSAAYRRMTIAQPVLGGNRSEYLERHYPTRAQKENFPPINCSRQNLMNGVMLSNGSSDLLLQAGNQPSGHHSNKGMSNGSSIGRASMGAHDQCRVLDGSLPGVSRSSRGALAMPGHHASMHPHLNTINDDYELSYMGRPAERNHKSSEKSDVFDECMSYPGYPASSSLQHHAMNQPAGSVTSLQHYATIQPAENGAPCSDDMALVRMGDPSLVTPQRATSEEVTDLTMYTERTFCTEDNVSSCIIFLNQTMLQIGLPSLLDKSSESFDIVGVLNNSYRLIERVKQLNKQREEQDDRLHRVESDLDCLHRSHDTLKQTKCDLEEELKQSLNNAAMLMVKNNQLTLQVKAGKDEIKRLQLMIQNKENQYKHESKKKERELVKLKDRLNQMLKDKTDRKNGSVSNNEKVPAPAASKRGGVQQGIKISPEIEEVLVTENQKLRVCLCELRQELDQMIVPGSTDSNHVDNDDNDDSNRRGSSDDVPHDEDSTNYTRDEEGLFEMPYSMVEREVIDKLREKCCLLKAYINNLEMKGKELLEAKSKKENTEINSTENSEDKQTERERQEEIEREREEEIERLRDHLQQCQQIISQQELTIQQQQHDNGVEGMSGTCLTWLTEGRALEEEEMLRLRRKYLEEAQRLFNEATGVVQREKQALEEAKYSILHKEFMTMTPFKTRLSSGSAKPLGVGDQLYGAIKNSIRAAKRQHSLTHMSDSPLTPVFSGSRSSHTSTPTTADLYRVLGIIESHEKRRSEDSQDGVVLRGGGDSARAGLGDVNPSTSLKQRMRWISEGEGEEGDKDADIRMSLFSNTEDTY